MIEVERTPDSDWESAKARSWAWACRPTVPETIVPEDAFRDQDPVVLGGAPCRMNDPRTFVSHHAKRYLDVVHARRLQRDFPALREGHFDECGNHFSHVLDDPRIGFGANQDPRYTGENKPVKLSKSGSILIQDIPGLTLPPSKTGYNLGRSLAEVVTEMDSKSPTIFEMGVGGGVIMASFFAHYPDTEVHYMGSDIDGGCLVVAETNMRINGVSPEEFRLVKGNLLEPFRGLFADVIISNPPFLPANKIDPSIGPHKAIFGGEDGMYFYHQLMIEGRHRLKPGGKMILQTSNCVIDHVRNMAYHYFGKDVTVKVIRHGGKIISGPTTRGIAVLIET